MTILVDTILYKAIRRDSTEEKISDEFLKRGNRKKVNR